MRMGGKTVGWVGLAALFLAQSAGAATITLADDAIPTVLALEGDIVPGDAEAFKSRVRSARDRGQPITTLMLDSLGGTFMESVRIAEVVATERLRTYVPSGLRCGSGCFIIFAAGRTKIAEKGSHIGVHRASNTDLRADDERSSQIAALIFRQLSVPEAIIGKMLDTPFDKVTWLTETDLQSMGVILVPASE